MKLVETKQATPGVPAFVEVEEAFKSGGEGNVYFSRDGRYAVKIYHKLTEDRENKLTKIRSLFNQLSQNQLRFILPPLALVATFAGQPAVGFVMRRVPHPDYQDLVELVKSPVRAAPFFQKGLTWESFLKIARSVANSVAVLHGKGCAHGDLSYRNFLADIVRGDAVMLELDGIIIEGFMRAEVKGTPGFMAPEVLTKNTAPNLRTDCYSLAVLSLYTLLFRNVMEPQIEYSQEQADSMNLGFGQYAVFSEHPKDDRNRPHNVGKPLYSEGALSYKMLPPRLQRLTESTLMLYLHLPEKRPSSREWADALALTLDEIGGCNYCGNRFPYPYWQNMAVACPFCGQSVRTVPLLLKVYEEGFRSEYRSLDRVLVMERGASLYRDMTHNKEPVPLLESERVPTGHVDWNATQRCYRLVNESDDSWVARPLRGGIRRYARRGEAITIEEGACIQFGQGQRVGVVMNPGISSV